MQLGQPTLWLSWGTLLHPRLAPVARENLRWDTAVRSHWHASHGGAERQHGQGHPVASAPPALSPHKPLTTPPPSCCLPLSTSHSTPASRDTDLTFPTPMTSGPLHWLLPRPGKLCPRWSRRPLLGAFGCLHSCVRVRGASLCPTVSPAQNSLFPLSCSVFLFLKTSSLSSFFFSFSCVGS